MLHNWICLRARPLTLHLHFYMRDADADAGKCPTQPGIPSFWMKKFGGGAELPAFPRFMQGACYPLKTNKFFVVLFIIIVAFTGEFTLQVTAWGEAHMIMRNNHMTCRVKSR